MKLLPGIVELVEILSKFFISLLTVCLLTACSVRNEPPRAIVIEALQLSLIHI